MRWASSSHVAGAKRRATVIGVLIASLLASAVMLFGSEGSAAATAISGISPTSGTAFGGETMTINGSGFKSDYGDYIPVDYIQFYRDTGSTQMYPLIDTSVKMNTTTQVTATYMVTGFNNQLVWGAEGADEIRLESGDTSDPPQSSPNQVWQYFHYGSGVNQSNIQFAYIAQSSSKIRVTAGNGSVTASIVEGTGWISSGSHPHTATGNNGNIVVGGRQAGFFTGRIYGFSIVNGTVGSSNNVAFNGIPAYGWGINQETKVGSYQYGLYDTVSGQFFVNSLGGNQKVEGQIWGPSGVNGAAPKPPSVTVDFSGVNSHGGSVGGPCLPLTILSSTQATCTVPPAELGGDDSVTATVTVTVTDASGTTTAKFPYTYEGDRPALLSATPDTGPMTGGGLVNLTGKKFVTLLGALQYGGVNIDPPPGTKPAAWTVNNQTVYGFVDPVTGALTPATEGDGVVGLINNQVFPVTPTKVMFGQTAASTVTVLSLTTMTVTAPPNDPATVAVSIDKNGLSASMDDAYTYVAVGTLEVTMEGWACPAGATLDDIQTPGVCQFIPDGGYAISGTTVTWLYTVTYVSIGLDGTPLDASLGELTDVSVTDAKLSQVCTVAALPLNTPYPCVASGPVTPV